MSHYWLHGVSIESSCPLPAVAAAPATPMTLRVRFEHGLKQVATELGEVVASSDAPAARYEAIRSSEGLCCSYPGLGAVVFRPNGEVVVRVVDDAAESAAALLSGSALALWLVDNGRLVLHASAAAWDDLAVAVVGGSNAGKTTLVAQCVLAGARLLADDVLRIELDDGAACWYSGMQWLRLRSASSSLADAWPGLVQQSARDGRWVLNGAATVGSQTSGRLDALVFPTISDGVDVLVEPIGRAEALRRLVLAPRVRGLQAPNRLREQMQLNAQLARTVSSFAVALPKGPPFAPENAEKMRQRLRALLGVKSS